MSAEDNKAMHRRVYEEIWNQKNPALIDEVISDDYIYHLPASVPVNDPRGPEGYKDIFHLFINAFPDVNLHIEDMIAEGDLVTVRSTCSGTHRGDYMGSAPTGKQFSVMEMAIVRYKDGKIVEEWGGLERLDLIQQLGISPPTY